MAIADGHQPSVGGVTSTVWKGSTVLSAASSRYTHKRPEIHDMAVFTGARANLLDAMANVPLPSSSLEIISFSNVDFDTDAYWDISDASHLVIPAGLGGVFEIGYSGLLVGVSGELGLFQADVIKNDSELIILGRAVVNTVIDGMILNGSGLFDLADNDTISLGFIWNGFNDDELQTDIGYSPALWLGRWK